MCVQFRGLGSVKKASITCWIFSNYSKNQTKSKGVTWICDRLSLFFSLYFKTQIWKWRFQRTSLLIKIKSIIILWYASFKVKGPWLFHFDFQAKLSPYSKNAGYWCRVFVRYKWVFCAIIYSRLHANKVITKRSGKWEALLIRVKIWLFEGQEIKHSKPITRPVLDLRICCKISQVSALFTVKVILFFYTYRKLLTNVKDIPTTPVVCS